ncbi:FecR family protein [Agrobacterium sp. rho-13.3]|uniref:FecR family protein n=1 Tax=Agrobacterium sp. rho-13.3 TaxID=3072980 RepID=UPI002A0F9C82|nr:FecR domain-containing protein [Agrobacterium sp. rho-13.3]MDX8306361.1 FecR domain-containing protein [Agrobacterium sp. rho-13.3]MDX8307308.1 FecR domain-containing protein [Agrobacterium sp. rho-13.3]
MSSNMPDTKDAVGYRHADPIVDQALDWAVLLKASGKPSVETNNAFEAWLNENPNHKSAWEEISGIWASPEVLLASAGLGNALPRNPPIPPRSRRGFSMRTRVRVGALAAATAAVVLIGGQPILNAVSIRWQADYRTDAGQLQEISLPDGSRMLLNTQSAVALDFEGNKRGVRLLKGEAWFDVVHDASRPFHVAATFSDVEVKGTAFAVDVRAGVDTIVLERGAVVTRHEKPDIAPVNLQPGQMVRASSTSLSEVTTFDPDEALGWKDGRIILTGTPLRAALEQIGAYYQGKIITLNPSLANVTISGNYRIDNIEAAIDSVVAAAGGNTTHLPGGFIIIR